MYGPTSVYTPPAAPLLPLPVRVPASQTQVPTEGPYAGGFLVSPFSLCFVVLSCLVLSCLVEQWTVQICIHLWVIFGNRSTCSNPAFSAE
jgi:hypothetical protein